MSERRSRFIDAGTQVFGTIGLRRATVRGLCAAAGLTDRYFYESFDGLEALLQAVYEHQLSRHRRRLMAIGIARPVEGEDAWTAIEDDLRKISRTWFELVREPTFARIVLDEVLGVSPRIDALYLDRARNLAEVTLLPALVRLPALRAGLRGVRGELAGHAVSGAPIVLAKMWATGGYRQPMEDVIESCVQAEVGALQRIAHQLESKR